MPCRYIYLELSDTYPDGRYVCDRADAGQIPHAPPLEELREKGKLPGGIAEQLKDILER